MIQQARVVSQTSDRSGVAFSAFSQPLHCLFSCADCSCLKCNDSRWFRANACRAAGIRRHLGVCGRLLTLQRLRQVHPSFIHPEPWCQSRGISLVSWNPYWCFFCCMREAKTEKSLQCFQCVAHLAGATRCWCSSRCYFEYWTSLLLCTCSSRLTAAHPENANEADIQHQPACVWLPLTHFCQRPTNQ